MKKLLALLLILLMAVSLSSVAYALPNPVKEVTDYSELPALLPLLSDTVNVRYSSISDEIACADFEYYDGAYTLRAKASPALEDISGVYITFENSAEDNDDFELRNSDYKIYVSNNNGAEALAIWYDEANAISYSLYTEKAEELEEFSYLLEYLCDNMNSGFGILAMNAIETEGAAPVPYPVIMLRDTAASNEANENIKSFAENIAAIDYPSCEYYTTAGAFGALSAMWKVVPAADYPNDFIICEMTFSASTGEVLTLDEINNDNGIPLSEAFIKAFKENPASLVVYNYALDAKEADEAYNADIAYLKSLSEEEFTRLVTSAGAAGFTDAHFAVAMNSESSIVELTINARDDFEGALILRLTYYIDDIAGVDGE